jgi:hypothetical protein
LGKPGSGGGRLRISRVVDLQLHRAVSKASFRHKLTTERHTMRTSDLVKATVACGLAAYLVYEYPVLGQVVIIATLSLLWLSYLYRTIASHRMR